MAAGFDCDDETHKLMRRIDSAWHALHGARAATWHSPNSDNCAIEEMCQNTVNDLLDRLWRAMTAEQQKAADARPTRQKVTAG